MMRKFAQFFLVACVLVLPAVAQRGGGFHSGMGSHGFRGSMGPHGGGFAGPRFRGGFYGYPGGFRGGYFPRNHFVYRFGWAYPYPYAYYNPYVYYGYPYDPYWYPRAYSYPSDNYGYSYGGSDQTPCPQVNGRPVYQIKLTYQNNIWVAQDYWYKDGTLMFITLQGEQKKTPANTVEPAATLTLNGRCGVASQLPADKNQTY